MYTKALERGYDVMTHRILVLSTAKRIFFGYFSHYGVGDYVASSRNKVNVGFVEEILQRV
jgi:hypothetical protein